MSPATTVLIDGIHTYVVSAASPAPFLISSVWPSSVSVLPLSGVGMTGLVGISAPYIGPHCLTLPFQLAWISLTTDGVATIFTFGNACLTK
jgi:hypothetical protein